MLEHFKCLFRITLTTIGESQERGRSGPPPVSRPMDRVDLLGHGGFTLVELMLTITVLAVLATIGAPTMQEMLARNRLKAAAQALTEDLQWTRSEVIRRNRHLFLTVDSEAWCYGIAERKDCDCRLRDLSAERACRLSTAGEPMLKIVSGVDFPGIRIEGTTFTGSPRGTGFEPRRATARGGSLTFASGRDAELRVVLSLLGRVRLCSPRGTVTGFPPC